MTTVTVDTQLTFYVEHCVECGVPFGMSAETQRHYRRMRPGKHFYCPHGHPQHYVGESDAQRIRRLEQEKADAEARARREAASLRAALGEDALRWPHDSEGTPT